MTYTVCVICHQPKEETMKNTCSEECQRLKNNKASRIKNWKNKIRQRIPGGIDPKWLVRGTISDASVGNSMDQS